MANAKITSRATSRRAGAKLCMMVGSKAQRLPLRLEFRPEVNAFPATASSGSGYEISFRPDPSLYDGRYGNVGWLQELPKQVTNLSWDNAALVSMKTMADLKSEETGSD